MVIPIGGIGFGFLAGILSTLSPCVLPILPLVLGTALSTHRLGALALAGGLVVSFVGVGLFIATIGFSIGLDGDLFRAASAVVLVAMGLVLLSEPLQQRFALAIGGFSNVGNRFVAGLSPKGLGGQFILGVLLGAIWSPCVGPTLGATSILAAQGRDLGRVAAVMGAFALGTILPLAVIGALSRQAFGHWRDRFLGVAKVGKILLGFSTVSVALLLLTGFDRSLESALAEASPEWLLNLTTRY